MGTYQFDWQHPSREASLCEVFGTGQSILPGSYAAAPCAAAAAPQRLQVSDGLRCRSSSPPPPQYNGDSLYRPAPAPLRKPTDAEMHAMKPITQEAVMVKMPSRSASRSADGRMALSALRGKKTAYCCSCELVFAAPLLGLRKVLLAKAHGCF